MIESRQYMTDTRSLILYIGDNRDNLKLVGRFLEESYMVLSWIEVPRNLI